MTRPSVALATLLNSTDMDAGRTTLHAAMRQAEIAKQADLLDRLADALNTTPAALLAQAQANLAEDTAEEEALMDDGA